MCIHIKVNSRCRNSEASMVSPLESSSPSNPCHWRFKTFDRSWMLNWQHRIVGERFPKEVEDGPRKTSDKWGELTPIQRPCTWVTEVITLILRCDFVFNVCLFLLFVLLGFSVMGAF